jgi:hypothetical protein
MNVQLEKIKLLDQKQHNVIKTTMAKYHHVSFMSFINSQQHTKLDTCLLFLLFSTQLLRWFTKKLLCTRAYVALGKGKEGSQQLTWFQFFVTLQLFLLTFLSGFSINHYFEENLKFILTSAEYLVHQHQTNNVDGALFKIPTLIYTSNNLPVNNTTCNQHNGKKLAGLFFIFYSKELPDSKTSLSKTFVSSFFPKLWKLSLKQASRKVSKKLYRLSTLPLHLPTHLLLKFPLLLKIL